MTCLFHRRDWCMFLLPTTYNLPPSLPSFDTHLYRQKQIGICSYTCWMNSQRIPSVVAKNFLRQPWLRWVKNCVISHSLMVHNSLPLSSSFSHYSFWSSKHLSKPMMVFRLSTWSFALWFVCVIHCLYCIQSVLCLQWGWTMWALYLHGKLLNIW